MTDAAHTPGSWGYDGEDIDSEAAHLVAEEAGFSHDGYEIFSLDKDGQVDMPIGTALEENDARVMAASPDLLAACKAQHEAIDILFSMLIEQSPRDKTFYPSKSGAPWEAAVAGKAAIDKAEGRS